MVLLFPQESAVSSVLCAVFWGAKTEQCWQQQVAASLPRRCFLCASAFAALLQPN